MPVHIYRASYQPFLEETRTTMTTRGMLDLNLPTFVDVTLFFFLTHKLSDKVHYCTPWLRFSDVQDSDEPQPCMIRDYSLFCCPEIKTNEILTFSVLC